MMSNARAAHGFFALAVVLVACGGAPEAAKSPPAASPATAPGASRDEERADKSEAAAAPRTIAEAQDQIARARAALDSGAPGSSSGETSSSRPSTTSPSPPEPRRPADAPADPCLSSCRALDSMRRAVEALCRMTGDGDDRCVDAKKTLSDSTSRLSTCRCAPH
jgi:hypothetical protein